jgi:major vault protein
VLFNVSQFYVVPIFFKVLNETTAVHVRALRSFKDQMGLNRKTGEEYLITLADMESFIPEVYEEIIGEVDIITLTSRQYCVIENPLGKTVGKNLLFEEKGY